MVWSSFGVGLVVGTFFGMLIIGLCQMASKTWNSQKNSFEMELLKRKEKSNEF